MRLARDGVVAAACVGPLGAARPLGVNGGPPRELRNKEVTKMIREIHADSRGSYGSPRVHAELRPGLGMQVNRKRVEQGLTVGAPRRALEVVTAAAPSNSATRICGLVARTGLAYAMISRLHNSMARWETCCLIVDGPKIGTQI